MNLAKYVNDEGHVIRAAIEFVTKPFGPPIIVSRAPPTKKRPADFYWTPPPPGIRLRIYTL